MRDSSKSNRVTSPGFLPSLQQKAAHCTPRVSMKPKPPSRQRARNKLSRGISLRAAAERALGKTEATSWGLKAQSRITEQVPDTPPAPPGEGIKITAWGDLGPSGEKGVRNQQDANRIGGRKQRIKRAKGAPTEVNKKQKCIPFRGFSSFSTGTSSPSSRAVSPREKWSQV